METMKSKRRSTHERDEVDVAITGMKRGLRYNVVSKNRWKLLIMVAIVFVTWTTFIPFIVSHGPSGTMGVLMSVALQLIIGMGYAIMFIVVQMGFVSRSRIYWIRPGETGLMFSDYKGNPEVLEAAKEIVELMKGAEEFKAIGGDVIRGFLLYGPPGTGKSYLAQCIANEAGLPIGYASAPSLEGMYVGASAMKVRGLYRKARRLAREYGGCVLFLDEIDAVTRSRSAPGGMGMGAGMGGMMGGGQGLLNELLMQMDPPPVDERWLSKILRDFGIVRKKVDNPPVLTMAATNTPDALDAALLRPGRFDRQIAVEAPTAKGRREIIEYYLDKVNHENMPLERMVADTMGYTPVAIRYVINEGVIRARRNSRDTVIYKDFLAAIDFYESGLKQRLDDMSLEERKRIAYHEAGHAIATLALMPWTSISKITIVRHGGALGFVKWRDKEERYTQTAHELEARMQVSLASRAAEELFLDLRMSGFSGDLANATQLAFAYIGAFGMDDRLFSAVAAGGFDKDHYMQDGVQNLLAKQFKKVKALLDANRALVHAMVEELLAKEELFIEDIDAVVMRIGITLTIDAKAKRLGFHIPARPREQMLDDGGVGTIPGYALPAGTPIYVEEGAGVAAAAHAPQPGIAAQPAPTRHAPTPPTPKVSVPQAKAPGVAMDGGDDFLPKAWK